MPYHKVPRARLHEDITSIEREGERVTAVVPDGDVFHVFTGWVGERVTLDVTPMEYR